MRCEVSTLPPATAAGGCALTIVPRGRNDGDWAHQAGGGGDVFGEQAAENVVDGGDGDGFDSVNVAGALRRGTGEINFGVIASYFDAARMRSGLVADAVAVEEIFGGVGAGWQFAQRGPHHVGGIVQQVAAVGLQFRWPYFATTSRGGVRRCGRRRFGRRGRLRVRRECERWRGSGR